MIIEKYKIMNNKNWNYFIFKKTNKKLINKKNIKISQNNIKKYILIYIKIFKILELYFLF